MSGILSGLFSGKQEGATAMTDILQQIVSQNGGGVPALLTRLQQGGLGNQAEAWMSGDHQPITGDHIGQVFTDDEIAGWATQAGIDPNMMRDVLAEALPHAIDHATPNNEVPAPNATPNLAGLIGRFFGRAAILLMAVLASPSFADETVAGQWKANIGSSMTIVMHVTPDGMWDSTTAKGETVVAQMSGTYQQNAVSATGGRLVFTPTHSTTNSLHGAAEVERDVYAISNNGTMLRLTANGDTMIFHKQ